jgi:hypothetical protein
MRVRRVATDRRLTIPAVNEEGLPLIPPVDPHTHRLPAGRHSAIWAEVKTCFVDEAPQREQRQLAYSALRLWAEMVWQLFPTARFWIDGGFVTHKATAPFDVDALVIVSAPELAKIERVIKREHQSRELAVRQGLPVPKCPTSVRFFGLLSLTDVSAAAQGGIPRLQPFGGLVDGFLASENNVDVLNYWNAQWSTGEDEQHTGTKGYLEVSEHE